MLPEAKTVEAPQAFTDVAEAKTSETPQAFTDAPEADSVTAETPQVFTDAAEGAMQIEQELIDATEETVAEEEGASAES